MSTPLTFLLAKNRHCFSLDWCKKLTSLLVLVSRNNNKIISMNLGPLPWSWKFVGDCLQEFKCVKAKTSDWQSYIRGFLITPQHANGKFESGPYATAFRNVWQFKRRLGYKQGKKNKSIADEKRLAALAASDKYLHAFITNRNKEDTDQSKLHKRCI